MQGHLVYSVASEDASEWKEAWAEIQEKGGDGQEGDGAALVLHPVDDGDELGQRSSQSGEYWDGNRQAGCVSYMFRFGEVNVVLTGSLYAFALTVL